MEDLFDHVEGFEWDAGNSNKNLIKHNVNNLEAEQIFNNEPLIVGEDDLHSAVEKRYYAYGKTNEGRKLYTVFTLRGSKIRIISSRNMDRYERKLYEKEKA